MLLCNIPGPSLPCLWECGTQTFDMKTIRTVILGTGFMGRVRTEAIRRVGNVDVVGVVGSAAESEAFCGDFFP